MTLLRATARRLKLGTAALLLYHRPAAFVRRSLAEGGPIEQRRTAQGHRQMVEAAADDLPTLTAISEGPVAEISFLSGPKFWHQTVFCFASLQRVVPFRVTPVIYDDGGLASDTREHILRIIPWAQFVGANEIDERLNRLLPESRFPALRQRRRDYPHLRKLTDIHIASRQFKLVADSDMLFFRTPIELLDWFNSPFPLHMQDTATHYGYPLPFMSALAGAPIPQPVNVGLYAVDGALIDWEKVEHWCRRQLEDFGPHYFQEQALTAMLLAGKDAVPLPREAYIVKPNVAEGRSPTAVLHHYVSDSKRSYFQHGWQRILEDAMSDSKGRIHKSR